MRHHQHVRTFRKLIVLLCGLLVFGRNLKLVYTKNRYKFRRKKEPLTFAKLFAIDIGAAKFSGNETANAIETELDPNDRFRYPSRSPLVPTRTQRRITERYSRLDVLFYNLLDAICPFRGTSVV